jgi:hypothetical protein
VHPQDLPQLLWRAKHLREELARWKSTVYRICTFVACPWSEEIFTVLVFLRNDLWV